MVPCTPFLIDSIFESVMYLAHIELTPPTDPEYLQRHNYQPGDYVITKGLDLAPAPFTVRRISENNNHLFAEGLNTIPRRFTVYQVNWEGEIEPIGTVNNDMRSQSEISDFLGRIVSTKVGTLVELTHQKITLLLSNLNSVSPLEAITHRVHSERCKTPTGMHSLFFQPTVIEPRAASCPAPILDADDTHNGATTNGDAPDADFLADTHEGAAPEGYDSDAETADTADGSLDEEAAAVVETMRRRLSSAGTPRAAAEQPQTGDPLPSSEPETDTLLSQLAP